MSHITYTRQTESSSEGRGSQVYADDSDGMHNAEYTFMEPQGISDVYTGEQNHSEEQGTSNSSSRGSSCTSETWTHCQEGQAEQHNVHMAHMPQQGGSYMAVATEQHHPTYHVVNEPLESVEMTRGVSPVCGTGGMIDASEGSGANFWVITGSETVSRRNSDGTGTVGSQKVIENFFGESIAVNNGDSMHYQMVDNGDNIHYQMVNNGENMNYQMVNNGGMNYQMVNNGENMNYQMVNNGGANYQMVNNGGANYQMVPDGYMRMEGIESAVSGVHPANASEGVGGIDAYTQSYFGAADHSYAGHGMSYPTTAQQRFTTSLGNNYSIPSQQIYTTSQANNISLPSQQIYTTSQGNYTGGISSTSLLSQSLPQTQKTETEVLTQYATMSSPTYSAVHTATDVDGMPQWTTTTERIVPLSTVAVTSPTNYPTTNYPTIGGRSTTKPPTLKSPPTLYPRDFLRSPLADIPEISTRLSSCGNTVAKWDDASETDARWSTSSKWLLAARSGPEPLPDFIQVNHPAFARNEVLSPLALYYFDETAPNQFLFQNDLRKSAPPFACGTLCNSADAKGKLGAGDKFVEELDSASTMASNQLSSDTSMSSGTQTSEESTVVASVDPKKEKSKGGNCCGVSRQISQVTIYSIPSSKRGRSSVTGATDDGAATVTKLIHSEASWEAEKSHSGSESHRTSVEDPMPRDSISVATVVKPRRGCCGFGNTLSVTDSYEVLPRDFETVESVVSRPFSASAGRQCPSATDKADALSYVPGATHDDECRTDVSPWGGRTIVNNMGPGWHDGTAAAAQSQLASIAAYSTSFDKPNARDAYRSQSHLSKLSQHSQALSRLLLVREKQQKGCCGCGTAASRDLATDRSITTLQPTARSVTSQQSTMMSNYMSKPSLPPSRRSYIKGSCRDSQPMASVHAPSVRSGSEKYSHVMSHHSNRGMSQMDVLSQSLPMKKRTGCCGRNIDTDSDSVIDSVQLKERPKRSGLCRNVTEQSLHARDFSFGSLHTKVSESASNIHADIDASYQQVVQQHIANVSLLDDSSLVDDTNSKGESTQHRSVRYISITEPTGCCGTYRQKKAPLPLEQMETIQSRTPRSYHSTTQASRVSRQVSRPMSAVSAVRSAAQSYTTIASDISGMDSRRMKTASNRQISVATVRACCGGRRLKNIPEDRSMEQDKSFRTLSEYGTQEAPLQVSHVSSRSVRSSSAHSQSSHQSPTLHTRSVVSHRSVASRPVQKQKRCFGACNNPVEVLETVDERITDASSMQSMVHPKPGWCGGATARRYVSAQSVTAAEPSLYSGTSRNAYSHRGSTKASHSKIDDDPENSPYHTTSQLTKSSTSSSSRSYSDEETLSYGRARSNNEDAMSTYRPICGRLPKNQNYTTHKYFTDVEKIQHHGNQGTAFKMFPQHSTSYRSYPKLCFDVIDPQNRIDFLESRKNPHFCC